MEMSNVQQTTLIHEISLNRLCCFGLSLFRSKGIKLQVRIEIVQCTVQCFNSLFADDSFPTPSPNEHGYHIYKETMYLIPGINVVH